MLMIDIHNNKLSTANSQRLMKHTFQ